MNNYGVILQKLRELNRLTIKQAAKRIERSAGWLSEIENGKGAARIHLQEFKRIVAAYDGETLTQAKLSERTPWSEFF